MTSRTAMRNRYVDDQILTVPPARLVTMLYDRLVRDLVEAEEAIAAGDIPGASDRLLHAQDIVMELHAGLRPELWSGGPGLANLYLWLHGELIAANVAKDAARVAAARGLIEPLRDAWHQAAGQLAAGP
jgi:flagellar secretion chaperone FliS